MFLDLYKKCSDETCRLLYIRSMGNAGLPDFKQTIFDAISDKSGSSMMGFTAVQALRRIPAQFLEKQVIVGCLCPRCIPTCKGKSTCI